MTQRLRGGGVDARAAMTSELAYFIRFIRLRSKMRDFANRMKDFPYHFGKGAVVSAEQMAEMGCRLRKMIDDI